MVETVRKLGPSPMKSNGKLTQESRS